jgi:hypothetical protein
MQTRPDSRGTTTMLTRRTAARRRMPVRTRIAVEILENRALLVATVSFPGGMASGITNVNGQVDSQSLPLGNLPIQPELPSNGMPHE